MIAKLSIVELLQVVGDRGHRVALLDREARNRQIGAVQPHQGDVGSVQRGHVGQAPGLACVVIAEHLPRQHRTHRVRNGIVHVQQVQVVQLGHLGHARRQRKVVGRIFEERILRDLDLVKVNARMRLGEPDRLRVGDEMDLVSAIGQLNAELGGHHSAAAIGGITGNADPHGSPGLSFVRSSDCG